MFSQQHHIQGKTNLKSCHFLFDKKNLPATHQELPEKVYGTSKH